jgi:hypothetical protein
MSTALENLWPDDFIMTEIRPPVVVLKEQAAFLGQMTKNIVVGEVRTESSLNGGFSHNLYLVAPALNYRYFLLKVTHGIELYPAMVVFIPEGGIDREVDSEEGLKSALRKVFAADKTKRVLNSLLSQSKSADPF